MQEEHNLTWLQPRKQSCVELLQLQWLRMLGIAAEITCYGFVPYTFIPRSCDLGIVRGQFRVELGRGCVGGW